MSSELIHLLLDKTMARPEPRNRQTNRPNRRTKCKTVFVDSQRRKAAGRTLTLSDKDSVLKIPYSAFRQKFPKLWTSEAHSFLQQIIQNKNWAHPKATTLPRICKVEMQQASLLYYSAKPQSGGILGCALRHCTSEPFDSRRFVEACRAYRSVLTVRVVRPPS